jgi:hypothetical protein
MLLLLLLLILLCLTLPFTAATILNSIGAASRAVAATLDNALDSVYAQRQRHEIAEAAADEAERLRLADAQVPPTPTYTPSRLTPRRPPLHRDPHPDARALSDPRTGHCPTFAQTSIQAEPVVAGAP